MRRGAVLLILGLAACSNGRQGSRSDQTCGEPPPYEPSLESVWPTDQLPAESEGPATVRQLSPFELVFDAGWSWSIEMQAPSIPLGARVYARVELNHFGFAGRGGALAVWALRQDGTAGGLAFATWSGSEYARQGFGNVGYRVEPSARLVCGLCSQTRRMQQHRFSGTGIEPGLADGGTFGPYTFRGYAWVQEHPPEGACFDIGNGPYQAGRLERFDLDFEVVTPPIDCAALDPIECPDHPECSLFGGDGVPITCQRTLAGCERKDEGACVTDPACVWWVGVEGTSGACRQSCAVAGWSMGCDFETMRFCQALDAADEACAPSAPGFCQRRPGAECTDYETQVCACYPGNGWALVYACGSAAAFVRTATACGM